MKLHIIAMAIGTTGCASIMHGTTQDVAISSSPSGAQVVIDNQPAGSTPIIAHLKRNENHILKLDVPGYLPYETGFTKSVSGWVWGNVLFGGLIGLAVDAISGGLYYLTPEQLAAEMRNESAKVSSANDGSILLFVTLQPKPG